jgi:NAD(P)-dependent dehydrogenase (short-subunit alcohol dehydrogenase family)
MEAERIVLVTGATSGIGHAMADLLAVSGWRVYGTSRAPSCGAARWTPLAMDVTDDASVAWAVAEVLYRSGRLDAVVNNAGTTLIGALEETSPAEALRLLDTNLIGVHRVTRAALPALRESRGRVVVIGSIAGFLPKPFEGFYAASKHALEAWTETLRFETERFGIAVSLVEPGFVRTGLAARASEAGVKLPEYAAARPAAAARLIDDVQRGVPPEVVARCVRRILRSRTPRLKYRVGREAHVVRLLRTILPDSLFAVGLRKRFGPP